MDFSAKSISQEFTSVIPRKERYQEVMVESDDLTYSFRCQITHNSTSCDDNISIGKNCFLTCTLFPQLFCKALYYEVCEYQDIIHK